MFNAASVATGGGGDGYVAIPFQDRFYYMNHHLNPGSGRFVCHEKDAASTSCASFGGTQILPNQTYWIPLPDGDPAPAGTPAQQLVSSAADANEEYAIIGNRFLYYPVTRYNQNAYAQNTPALDWGVGCFDMVNNSECGFQQLSANSNNGSYQTAVEGPFAIGNNLYLLDLESVVHCVTANPTSGAMSPCAGTSSLDLYSNTQTLLPRFNSDYAGNGVFGRIGGEVVGDQFFLTIIFRPGRDTPAGSQVLTGGTTKIVVCIDTVGTTTMMPCSSWSGVGYSQDFQTFESRYSNISNYLYYDNSMNPIAICNRRSNQQSCVRLANGLDDNSLADITNGFNVTHGIGREVVYGTKSFFPDWARATLYCFDWSTGSPCGSPFPMNTNGTPLASFYPSDYTLNIDEGNCIWALGDNNQLYSLSAVTSTAPCNSGFVTNMAAVECELADWHQLNVSNIVASDYQYLIVEVLDNTGTWQSYDLLANSSVNLQGGNYSGLTQLDYKVTAQFSAGTNSFTSSAPVLTISADETPCAAGGGDGGSIVKVCKVAGDGVDIGTPFTFGSTWGDTSQAQQSNMVTTTVPAGPGPGGYCAIALTGLDPNDEVIVGELAMTGYGVVDITTAGAGVPSDINIPDRYAQFDSIGAGVTEVTFTNQRRFGFIEICKFSDSISDGDYTFNINPAAAVSSVTVPVNGCSRPIEVPAGAVTVTEVGLPNSVSMTDCGAWPSGNLVSCDLSSNSITASVEAGGIGDQTLFGFANERKKETSSSFSRRYARETMAPFWLTNPKGIRSNAKATGAIKVCKEAGPGVNEGDVFTFAVDVETEENHPNVEVAAGSCAVVEVNIDPSSSVSVTETGPAGYGVIDIDVQGNGSDIAIDLDDGIVDIGQINAGVTEVTFTNESRIGYIEICKQGSASGNFTFAITHPATGQTLPSVTVPSGACTPAIQVPSGVLEITESANANTLLQSCSTLPAAAQIACDINGRVSTIEVQPGSIANQTIAIFENCQSTRVRGRNICLLDAGVGVGNPGSGNIPVPVPMDFRKNTSNTPPANFREVNATSGEIATEGAPGDFVQVYYKPGERAPHDKEAEGLNARMLNELKQQSD